MSTLPRCSACGRTENIRKYGFRKTSERGKVQRFQCTACRKTFCADKGFRWKHKPPSVIIDTVSLYANGLTLRETARFMQLCKGTVLRWIQEYSILLQKFLANKVPAMSMKLHLDELYLKMRNTFYYLWDSICAETKFAMWFLSQTRRIEDATLLLNISPNPVKLVTDGAFTYQDPIEKKFGVRWTYDAYHRCANFEDKKNNNMVERLQNTLRRWLHPKRGFRSLRTGNIMLNFAWVFYNFVRNHSAICCTPAEKAGVISYFSWIKTEKQRWLFLIERASYFLLFFVFEMYQPYFEPEPF